MKKILLNAFMILLLGNFTSSASDRFQKRKDIISNKGNVVMQKLLDAEKLRIYNTSLAIDNPTEIIYTSSVDGIVFDTTGKSLFTYNANDSISTVIEQEFVAGQYENLSRSTYFYFSNRLDSISNESYDGGVWSKSGTIELKYNAAGKTIRFTFSLNFPGLGNLVFFDQRLYYNAQNYLTSYSVYSLNFQTFTTSLTDSSVFTNNANGIVLSEEQFVADMLGTITKDSKIFYTYDAQQRITLEDSKTWDLSTLSYLNDEQIAYTYLNNLKDFATSELKLWDAVSAYDNDQRIERTFNPNGDILTELIRIWDGIIYVNFERGTFTYVNNKLSIEFYELFENGSWLGSERYFFKYGAVGLNTINLKLSPSKIFPNPTESNFTFQFNSTNKGNADLTILDYSGKLILERNNLNLNVGENSILIEERLIKGIYLVKVQTDKTQYIQKLIIN